MLQTRHIAAPCLLLLVLALNASTQAQAPLHSSTEPIQVSGQLRYQNGQPANEVTVRLEAFSGGSVGEVRTDRLGKFRFPGLSPKQYQIVIRHPGYQEIRHEVNLVMVSAEYVPLLLIPEAGPARPPASRTVIDASVPTEARKEFEKADEELATGKPEKISDAIRHLERAISLHPNFLEAQLRLGGAYMDLRQWDNAERALRRALEINPRTANAFFALGEIYWLQKKYDECEKSLREGLVIEDRSWLGHFTLGRVYWVMGSALKDDAQARPFFQRAYEQSTRALELKPDLAGAHLLKGNLLLRAGRIRDAQKELEEYLRLEPKGEYAAQVRDTVQKLKTP